MGTNHSQIELSLRGARAVTAGLGRTGQAVTSLRRKVTGAGTALSRFDKRAQSTARSTTQTTRTFKGLVGQSTDLTKKMNAAAAGIRQIGQGLMSIGTMMTVLVSIPAGLALKRIVQNAIEFEDAMVGVQKTTNLASNAMEEMSQTGQVVGNNMDVLSKGIRELSQVTPTAVSDLAEMAQAAGQMGLTSTTAIMQLVETANQLGVATDIASKDAVLTLGKLASAFQLPLDDIDNLASAINALENSTAAASAEIVKSMLSASSSAATLGIAAHHVGAMSAVLISMGLSGEEAGTSLRRLFDDLIKNRDTVSQALGYESVQAFARALDRDAVGVILKFINAIEQLESRTGKAMAASDTVTERGKKALLRMAAGYKAELLPALKLVNQEMVNGTSLVDEYGRAIGTTKSMMAILRNNVDELARTMGEVLLPYLVKFANIVVPTIQLAAQGFTDLSERTKLMTIAFIALLAILGPLTLTIGTLMFGLGIMATGMASAFGSVLGPLSLMLGLVTELIPMILLIGTTMGVVASATGTSITNIINVFSRLVSDAYTWGLNLMGSYAAGIIQGAVAYVQAAIQYVANLVASFLASFSPPKKGPLRKIAIWGSNLMETYLRAFANADFGILSTITGMVQSFFTSLAQLGDIAEDAVPGAILGVRDKVAKLVSIFNETGIISQSVLTSIADKMGELGGPLTKLLSLQLKYNQAVNELNRLEGRRGEIQATYKSEIRAIERRTDLTAAQKTELIRQSRARRDASQDTLRVEEDAAKKNVEAIKDQVAWQKSFVDELLRGMQLLAQGEASTVPKAPGMPKIKKPKIKIPKIGKIGEILPDLSIGEAPDVSGAIQPLLSGLDKARAKADELRFAWEMFKKGLTGEIVDSWLLAESERGRKMYMTGKSIHDQYLRIRIRLTELRAEYERINTASQAFIAGLKGDAIDESLMGITSGSQKAWEKGNLLRLKWLEINDTLGIDIPSAIERVKTAFTDLVGLFLSAFLGPQEQMDGWLRNMELAPSPLERLVEALKKIGTAIAGGGLILLNEIFETLAIALEALQPYIPRLVESFVILVEAFADFVSDGDRVKALLENIATVIGLVVAGFLLLSAIPPIQSLAEFIGLLAPMDAVIVGLVTGALTFLVTHLDLVRKKLLEAKDNFMKAANGSSQFTLFMSRLGIVLGFVFKALMYIGAGLMAGIISLLPAAATLLGGFFGLIANGFNLAWDFAAGIWELAGAFLELLKTGDWKTFAQTVTSVMSTLKTDVIRLFTDWKDSLIQLSQDIWEGIKNWWDTLFDDLLGQSIVPDIINGVTEWFDKLLKIPERIAGFFTGLTEKFQALGNLIGSIKDKVLGFFGLGGDEEEGMGVQGLPMTQEDMTLLQVAFETMVTNMKMAWEGIRLAVSNFIFIEWAKLQQEFLNAQSKFTVFSLTVWSLVASALIPITRLWTLTIKSTETAVNSLQKTIIKLHKVAMERIKDINKQFEDTKKRVDAASKAVDELIQKLNAIPRHITVKIKIQREGAVPALQHGGPALAGQPHLVGEQGPELFVPERSGIVFPHQWTKAFLGSSGGGNKIVNIEKIVVRNDRDIQQIVDLVSKELGVRANTRLRFAG